MNQAKPFWFSLQLMIRIELWPIPFAIWGITCFMAPALRVQRPLLRLAFVGLWLEWTQELPLDGAVSRQQEVNLADYPGPVDHVKLLKWW